VISNLYQSTSLHALFRKSQFTIFAITFVICSCTFATISMFTMETYAKQNLQLLSQTVIERIQPAVVFKDKGAIDQILKDYTTEHAIRSIHVYDPQQQLLAERIKPLTHIAQLVSDQKAYNLRFPNNHIKEFQNLNNVFNELLEEIQIWNTNLQKGKQAVILQSSS